MVKVMVPSVPTSTLSTVIPGEEHPICTYSESPGKVAELAIKLFESI